MVYELHSIVKDTKCMVFQVVYVRFLKNQSELPTIVSATLCGTTA